ncbi:hypothetical protein E2C01_091792 [Portunus trituberculatus]|uniref:Uncharacterized protein n=1 Tax=Portunus trituberculatus TaxID=210409 RepID=A0A5B7JNX5_PORTR|nr:hypothetical protein [Portunus trituberculatus]
MLAARSTDGILLARSRSHSGWGVSAGVDSLSSHLLSPASPPDVISEAANPSLRRAAHTHYPATYTAPALLRG